MSHGRHADKIFANLYPLLYAAETPVSGSYREMSKICARLANAHMPLDGKDVFDIGCGYGTTTMEIILYNPHRVVARDNSSEMLELMMRALGPHDELIDFLEKSGAERVLERYYDLLVEHLDDMRCRYEISTFGKSHGILDMGNDSGLQLRTIESLVDVVIGNNYLHWPVNQRIAEMRKNWTSDSQQSVYEKACVYSLQKLASVMSPEGTMVLMEPSDFFWLDDNPEEDQAITERSLVSHPVFIKFQRLFNEYLLQKYGIKRSIPARNQLFARSTFGRLACAAGLDLLDTEYIESIADANPIDFFFVRLPLALGNLKMRFEEKLELGKLVREDLPKSLTLEELREPIRSQWFFFTLKKHG